METSYFVKEGVEKLFLLTDTHGGAVRKAIAVTLLVAGVNETGSDAFVMAALLYDEACRYVTKDKQEPAAIRLVFGECYELDGEPQVDVYFLVPKPDGYDDVLHLLGGLKGDSPYLVPIVGSTEARQNAIEKLDQYLDHEYPDLRADAKRIW